MASQKTILSKEDEEKATAEADTINAAEESIKVLLTKLKKIKTEKDVVIGSLTLNLIELQEEIGTKSAPFDSAAFAVESDIKELMPLISKSVKTENGSVSFRKGYTRTSYDAEALDDFLEAHPGIKKIISRFRIETPVKASIGKPEVY